MSCVDCGTQVTVLGVRLPSRCPKCARAHRLNVQKRLDTRRRSDISEAVYRINLLLDVIRIAFCCEKCSSRGFSIDTFGKPLQCECRMTIKKLLE